MFYDKQIRYLEYLENGEKIRSAGFVKIEVTDDKCNIQVNVTGLHPTENCSREVHLQGGNKSVDDVGVLGTIQLQAGKGSLILKRLPSDRLCEGIGYEELSGIRINLGKSRELFCRFREEKREEVNSRFKGEEAVQEVVQEATPQAVREVVVREATPQAVQEVIVQEVTQEVTQEAVRETVLQEVMQGLASAQSEPEVFYPEEKLNLEGEPNPEEELNPEGEPHSEKAPHAEEEPHPEESTRPAAPSTLPNISEDKWKQLSDIYPHISPFYDDRDYLSIGPGDFVILPRKYYRLVTNSFLLHGFYNYGHLILARTTRRGEELFYLGVPGNFFERERQVAIMFGFESFECKKEPAMDGDFGYFMKRIEL